MSNVLQETFREELQELLTDLEEGLLKLEQSIDDHEAVNRVFRTLHTIKGSGALAGFDKLSGFTHHVEAIFEEVRSGTLKVTSDLIDLALQAQDTIQSLAVDESGVDQGVMDGLIARMRQLHTGAAAAEGESAEGAAAERQQPPEAARAYWVRFRPPVDIFERGLDPANLVRELCRLGEARVLAHSDRLPALDELNPMACYVYWDILIATNREKADLQDIFIFVEDESEIDIVPVDSFDACRLDAVWPACIALLDGQATPDADQLIALFKTVDSGEVGYRGPERRGPAEDRRSPGDRRQGSGGGDGRGLSSSVRVRSERLDKLVDLIGELVTVQARLKQISTRFEDADLDLVAEDVEQLTWELRDEVLSIRMVPIGSTFNRFARQVRDLGRDLGKEVQLVTSGGETELDKTVIERLSDPILHLLRNAIDHGLERPERRIAAGKSERGTIQLSAGQSGAYVLIEIRDDGAGLNLEWIERKALSNGLLKGGEEVSPAGVWDLISAPGFSTSETVTSLSGRGVGLDVVRKAIDDLRGTVEVETSAGEGTCFRLKLPLTLAIIDGLLVRIGRERYVMPLAPIEEILEQNRADVERQHGRDLLHVRGEIVPYLHLRREFRIDGEVPPIEQVIIANLDGFRIGFAVDEVIGEHQTVIKSLGLMYRDTPGLSGATVLGDGNVALILDLPALMRIEEARSRSHMEESPVSPTQRLH